MTLNSLSVAGKSGERCWSPRAEKQSLTSPKKKPKEKRGSALSRTQGSFGKEARGWGVVGTETLSLAEPTHQAHPTPASDDISMSAQPQAQLATGLSQT